MTAESAEFADYLTMENFFNAETSAMAQQNYPQGSAAPSHNGDYLMAPLENTYNYENSMDQQSHHPEKFDFHNNNNNVQYFTTMPVQCKINKSFPNILQNIL